MQFDFRQVSVPFRMRPGLACLEPDAVHLTPLSSGTRLHAEKQAVSRSTGALWAVDGFDPGDALAAIRAQASKAGVSDTDAGRLPLELQVEEDLVVLDTSTGRVPWMCVCVPSRWAPEEKIGRTLADIHGPVADGQALAAAMPHLLRVLSNGTHWERFVWTLCPSAQYDQHPVRHALPPWPETPDAAELANQCYLRAERQTFIPVLDAQGRVGPQTVFTIRVMVEPLATVVRSPEDARRLHGAIASMSPAVLDYKNIAPARTRLLRWLTDRAAGADPALPRPV